MLHNLLGEPVQVALVDTDERVLVNVSAEYYCCGMVGLALETVVMFFVAVCCR